MRRVASAGKVLPVGVGPRRTPRGRLSPLVLAIDLVLNLVAHVANLGLCKGLEFAGVCGPDGSEGLGYSVGLEMWGRLAFSISCRKTNAATADPMTITKASVIRHSRSQGTFRSSRMMAGTDASTAFGRITISGAAQEPSVLWNQRRSQRAHWTMRPAGPIARGSTA